MLCFRWGGDLKFPDFQVIRKAGYFKILSGLEVIDYDDFFEGKLPASVFSWDFSFPDGEHHANDMVCW
jgi:hypothetical protein